MSTADTRIMVTGANGQLGSALQEWSTYYPAMTFLFLTRADADITNRERIKQVIQDFQPHYIINAAAYTAVDAAEEESDKCMAVNAYALQNMTQSPGKHKIIQISSDYVYHNDKRHPLKESAPLKPKSVYAKSKWLAEEMLRASDTTFLIIRSSWIYSHTGHNFVKTMLRLAQEKEKLGIVDDQIGAPTYAMDLAEAILTIIQKDVNFKLKQEVWNQPYNYANTGEISWYDFAKTIFRLTEISVDVVPIPTSMYPTPAARPLWSVMNLEQIKSQFSVPIYNWEDSLKKCLDKLSNL